MILATVKMCLRRFKIVLIIYDLFGPLVKKKEASIAKVAEPMINFTSENILHFIKKFSDFGNQKDELLWARLQRDCIDLGVGMEYEV